MTSQELRRKAAEASEQAAAIVSAAEKENRETSEDEDTLIDKLTADAASFEKRASAIERTMGLVQKMHQSQGRVSEPLDSRSDDGLDVGNTAPRPGESEGDRRKSFWHFLECVNAVSERSTAPHEFERAQVALANLFRSKFRSWEDSKDKDVRDYVDRAKRGEIRNLAMSSGTAGGYLLPEAFDANLRKVMAPSSIVRPRATVIPMGAETIKVPSLDQTTAQSAGTPPYFGGVSLTWTGESVTIPSTEPGFRQTTLTLNEVTGYVPVGRTLLQKSAISLEPLIYTLFGGAAAYAEDYAFLRGSGVGKPIGILNAPATKTTAARSSATAFTFADFTLVWKGIIDESKDPGVWLCSKSAEGALLAATSASNSMFVQSGVYIAQTGNEINAGAAGVRIFNRPVIISTKLPALNTTGDIGFFDFSKYLIADGGPAEVAASDDYLFRTNERAFRIIHRVGGAPWLNNVITLEDATTTVSPFVLMLKNG